MHKHYTNYYWNKGKPYGLNEVQDISGIESYKIVVDPYFKRFTIEKYQFGKFYEIIYDSLLLDFRHLTIESQIAWHRQLVKEDNHQQVYLLRDHEDRAILYEVLTYENHLCRECETKSTLGMNLAVHRMFYETLGDDFNGVILYDMEKRPVMKKTYDFDSNQQEFTNLVHEDWSLKPKEILVYG